MKIFKTIVAALCLLIGAVWVLQGANIIVGSAMSGQGQWLIIGAFLVVFGLGLLYHTYKARGTGR